MKAARVAITLIPLLATLCPLGCATTGASTRDATGGTDSAGSNIDPERAYLSLEQITPPPIAPETPPDIARLSARGQRQERTARKLMAQQRYTEASIALERGLRYDPDHPVLHRALAELYFKAGNVPRAKQHAESSLEQNPADAQSHFILGCAQVDGGQVSAAILSFRTALACVIPHDDASTAPSTLVDASCRFRLAESLEQEGYLTAALNSFARFEAASVLATENEAPADSAPPKIRAEIAESMDRRARILERLHRFADAAALVSSLADADDRESSGFALRAARLWLQAGDTDRSLAAARQATGPDEAGVYDLYYDLYQLGSTQEKVKEAIASRLGARQDDHRLVQLSARFFERIGQRDLAVDVLDEFVIRRPSADDVRLTLIGVLGRSSLWDDAVSQCVLGITGNPSRTEEFVQSIFGESEDAAEVDSSSWAQAIASAVSRPKQQAFAYDYLRGRVAIAASRIDDATRYLGRCLQANPSFSPARESLGSMLIGIYEYNEALSVLRPDGDGDGDGDGGDTTSAAVERLLGRVHERLDDWDNAERHFRAAVIKNREDADSMFDLALVLRRKGDVNRAKIQLKAMLDKFPSHAAAREELIDLYSVENRRDAVIEQLQALRRHGKSRSVVARAEANLSSLRRPEPAAYRKTLQESMQLHGEDSRTWLAIAGSCGQGQWSLAREAYSRAAVLDPDNEGAVLGAIKAAEKLLDWESAAAELEAILPRRPNRHHWRIYLLQLYTYLQRYDDGLSFARREESRDTLPDDVRNHYRARMISLLRSMGRGDEILRQLHTWADENPDGSNTRWRLFEELLDQDKFAQALTLCQQLYDEDREDEAARWNLIRALLAAKRTERAAQFASEFVLQDPARVGALGHLLVVLDEAGRVDDVIELIDNRLQRSRLREPLQDMAARVLIRAKRFDKSIERIEHLIDEVVDVLKRISDPAAPRDDASSAPERVIHLPDEPYRPGRLQERLANLQRNAVYSMILARRYHDAEDRVKMVLGEFGDAFRFEFLKLLSLVHQLRGHNEEAAAVSERAFLMHPEDVGLSNDLAYGWIDQGVHMDKAAEMIRYALSRSPMQSAYLDTYGWLRYKRGEFSAARKWLSRAAVANARDSATDGDPVIHDHQGDTAWRLSDKDSAVRHWEAAVVAIKAAQEEDEQRELTSDERRVLREAPAKAKAALSGGSPAVARTAAEQRDDEGNEQDDVKNKDSGDS